MCQNSFLNTQKQGAWCGSRVFSNVPELIFEHSKTKSTVWLTLFLQCARIKSCFVFLFVFYHDSIDNRFVHEHFRISKRQTPGYKFKKHKTPVPNTKSIITKEFSVVVFNSVFSKSKRNWIKWRRSFWQTFWIII